jgi:aminopeptidase S
MGIRNVLKGMTGLAVLGGTLLTVAPGGAGAVETLLVCTTGSDADVTINGWVTASSRAEIGGCFVAPGARMTLEVHIKHPVIQNLDVTLIGPGIPAPGAQPRVYSLHTATSPQGDWTRTPNLDATYYLTLYAASNQLGADGTWELRVKDYGFFTYGVIDSWRLTINGSTYQPCPPRCY